jgi:hypothetical protein
MASSAVMGARWKVTSFITSTKMPPRPNISIGPNCGSRVMPRITSRPRRAHLLDEDAADVGVGRAALDAEHHQIEGVAHLLGVGQVDAHAAEVGFVDDVGRDDLQHHRVADAVGRGHGFIGGGPGGPSSTLKS